MKHSLIGLLTKLLKNKQDARQKLQYWVVFLFFGIMLKHLNITITGRVQRVSFRANTQKIARKFNIVGFVKNDKNGTVYVEAEGHQENLDEFLTWCKIGPNRATVKEVNVQPSEIKHYIDFKIIR